MVSRGNNGATSLSTVRTYPTTTSTITATSTSHKKEISSLYSESSRGPELDLMEAQLSAILVNEEFYQVLYIPCTSSSVSNDSRPLGEEWRRKICQWSFRVIDHFRLDREIVSFGLNLFDRFLVTNCIAKQQQQEQQQSPKNKPRTLKNGNLCTCTCPSCAQSIDSRTYQLAAMTSLYVAIKLHPDNNALTEDGMRRKRYFKLESFVELSRGQFGAADICRMEQVILQTLKWRVNPPTPMALVAYLLSLMPPIIDIPSASRPTYDLVLHVLQELSRYITELSVCLGSICSTSPASQVAYAAILVSMDLLTLKALPMRARDTFHAAVSMTSLQSGGTLLMPHKQKIRKLSHVLSKSLLPEMLLEDASGGSSSSNSSSCHPIVIARDFGLLNLSRINGSSSSSSKGSDSSIESSCQGSPTAVSQGCY
ncbi:diatom-specific cyclin [Seminavis robusta]|uniref:Diatom-specific cyclin n=1 Tax=Seminavis robusta TaxID=568900 RepID=A0A9N8E504_9STRA|nr:diatom-specific cyclin [Seminavis robusta]|eukprot:Sro555_g165810.1 diatom-specific cyclin (425) ;mRNA; r:52187-53569